MKPSPDQFASSQPGLTAVNERRLAAHRAQVAPESSLSQHIYLEIPGRSVQHKCRLVNSSATGYRAVLLSHRQDTAALLFKPGQNITLGHKADGWTRDVTVRWLQGNMMGLMITNPVTRLICADEDGRLQPYECKFLGMHSGVLYRVTKLEPAPSLAGISTLELPNGERFQVRLRWVLEKEICLQEVGQRKRLFRGGGLVQPRPGWSS